MNLEPTNLGIKAVSGYIVMTSECFTEFKPCGWCRRHPGFGGHVFHSFPLSRITRTVAWNRSPGILAWHHQASLSPLFPSSDFIQHHPYVSISCPLTFWGCFLTSPFDSPWQSHKSHPTSFHFHDFVGIFEFQTNTWFYKHSISHSVIS